VCFPEIRFAFNHQQVSISYVGEKFLLNGGLIFVALKRERSLEKRKEGIE
jgi:hypothetical protein